MRRMACEPYHTSSCNHELLVDACRHVPTTVSLQKAMDTRQPGFRLCHRCLLACDWPSISVQPHYDKRLGGTLVESHQSSSVSLQSSNRRLWELCSRYLLSVGSFHDS